MVAIGQTVTVVNKSGKVVKTSKHLANVFKEAKSAYLEKKAELTAKRDDGLSQKASTTNGSDSGRTTYERGPLRPRPTTHGSDSGHTTYERGPPSPRTKESHRDSAQSSRHSSRQSSHDHDSRTSRHREHSDAHHSRPSPDRGYSDSFYASDRSTSNSKSITRTSTAPLTASNLRHATTPSTTPTTPTCNPSRTSSCRSLERSELLRRRSDTDFTPSDRTLRPSRSHDSFDSDLAYGDDPLLSSTTVAPPGAIATEDELRTKMSGLQRLLQEAECAQYSAKAVITSLEKNPDAMAAVALTLAEISNLATKMAPGALMALKGSFPVIIGLLLSPEFLIAGGVALGVTVVSFGGYKIVKRLKLKKARKLEDADGKSRAGEESEEEEDEQLELEELSQLDRIDQWRRGIYLPAGADEQSVATSVEGEFVTPKAGKMLREEGVLAEKPKTKKEKDKPKDKSGKSKSAPTEKDLAKQLKEVEKQKKDLEKRERDLAKQKEEILKASERNVKLERKATIAESKRTEKREKAEKEMKQKQITEHGEDAAVSESGVVGAEKEKEKSDAQSLLKTIFRKTTEKEKGEVIA